MSHGAAAASHAAALASGDAAEGTGKTIMELLDVIIWVVGFVFDKATDVYALLAMFVFLGVGWYFGGSVAHTVYMATCAQIHCPHVTNIRCLGMPWGFCIQDIICPCCCDKYRPMFGLRLHIVKARYLQKANTIFQNPLNESAGGDMKVFCRVWAGNNPLKTTSMQTYNNPNELAGPAGFYNDSWVQKPTDIDRTGWQTVIWNEPVDLLVYPSTSNICICLHTLSMLGTEQPAMGTVNVPIGAFYEEDKATCSYLWCRCCACFPECFLTDWFKPTWPLVKGAPSMKDLQRNHAMSNATCRESIYRSLGLGTLAQIGMGVLRGEEEVDIDETTDLNTLMETLGDEGDKLKDAGKKYRSSKEVVAVAVRDDPEAMQYASRALRKDVSIQRLYYQLPEPMMLEVVKGGKAQGFMWAYMILTHEVSCETEFRSFIASVLRTFCCCPQRCIDYLSIELKRQELPNYIFEPGGEDCVVGEPVGVEEGF